MLHLTLYILQSLPSCLGKNYSPQFIVLVSQAQEVLEVSMMWAQTGIETWQKHSINSEKILAVHCNARIDMHCLMVW